MIANPSGAKMRRIASGAANTRGAGAASSAGVQSATLRRASASVTAATITRVGGVAARLATSGAANGRNRRIESAVALTGFPGLARRRCRAH